MSIALLISAILVAIVRWRMPDDQRSQMWYPLLNSPAPVLLVVGQPHIPQTGTLTANSAYDHSPASELELADAIAMAHLCAMLDAHRHLYQIIGVNSASLSDLRKGPAILVGGVNNPWTLRILDRFASRLHRAATARPLRRFCRLPIAKITLALPGPWTFANPSAASPTTTPSSLVFKPI